MKQMNPLIISEACDEDLPEMRALLFTSIYDLYDKSVSQRSLNHWLDYSTSRETIQKRITEPKTLQLVGRSDKKGIIATGYMDETGYIGGLAVLDQRRGIGSQLLDHFINSSKQELSLSVWEENKPALALVKSKGFKFTGIDPDKSFLSELKFLILRKAK